ncbi:MAG: hypothetical protein D6798_09215 [Deltaproteobacteria bacterium]|nr:MAG: hypothetical protein D6798_09215 [Deltaproteobacteria bacterium]
MTSPPDPPAPRARRLAWLLAAGWYLLLSLALTWPMALHPGRAALGSEHADGMKHLWTLWYMRASVWQEHALPGFTRLVNHPTGMVLYPIEPLHGAISALLPFADLVVLSNALVVANMVAVGLAGTLFGRALGGGWLGGILGGSLLVGSSIVAFFVHVGVGELWHLWWIPLGLTVLLRARATLRWRWFIALAACLAGATLTCFYHGFFLGMAVAVVALTTLWAGRRTPGLLLRYAVAAALAVAVTVPAIRTFSASYKTPEPVRVGLWSYVTGQHGQPVTDPVSARLQPDQLVFPARAATSRQQQGYVGGRYIGWVPLVMALIGVVRRPRRGLPLAAVAVLGGVLATGSYLVVAGQAVTMEGGIAVAMPLLWLNRALSYVAEPLNFPVRFLAMTAVALAGLVSLSVAGLRGPRGRLAGAAAVVAVAVAIVQVARHSATPWPWQRFELRPVGDIGAMRSIEDAAVVDLAMAWRSDPETRWNALLTQIAHGLPIQAVPVERVEYFAREGQMFVKSLDFVQALEPAFNNNTPRPPISPDKDLALLRDAGFGWLIVSYRTGLAPIPAYVRRTLDEMCGPPTLTGPGIAAWRIPDVEVSEEQLAAWRAEHDAAIAELTSLSSGLGPQLR